MGQLLYKMVIGAVLTHAPQGAAWQRDNPPIYTAPAAPSPCALPRGKTEHCVMPPLCMPLASSIEVSE